MLDSCLFNGDQSCGVIAQGLTEAQDLFENKVKFAYDTLPESLRRTVSATSDSARKIVFANGSSITVGTSLRGGTYQKLHISEYGKIAARYPDKAREIRTGALNTVHAGQQIFIESTAEGRQGEYFDLCEHARRLEAEGRALTALDPRFHFFARHRNPAYIYRRATGACKLGTETFMAGRVTKDAYTLTEILEATKDAFGGQRFKDVVGGRT